MALYNSDDSVMRKSESSNAEGKSAYVYRWTHVPTGKWYVGSRTAKGCYSTDSYLCSSREVKPLIQSNPYEWKREILATGSAVEMRNLEAEMLKQSDAKNNPKSFNRHNGDGKFTTLGRIEPADMKQVRAAKLKGIKKPEGFGNMVSAVHKGKSVSAITKQKIGIASTGRVQNADARAKNSEKNSGDKNPSFMGYYIAPNSEVFDSSRKAGEKYNVTRHTIVNWATDNKNGWSFRPKGVI